MPDELWTWDEQTHTNVVGVFADPTVDFAWCDQLETAPGDPTVGKVLCMCAAAAIARQVLAAHEGGNTQVADALNLLDRWINDPTDEQFERICSLIFGEAAPPYLDKHGVVWWALRTATTSVGNYEGGWALSSACSAAERAGFSPEQLRGIAERAVLARRGAAPGGCGTGK